MAEQPAAAHVIADVAVPAAIAVQAEPIAQGVLVPDVIILPDVEPDVMVNVPVNPAQVVNVNAPPVLEPVRADSNSLHTDDLLMDAQPGDATRIRQEMKIVMDGGNVVHHSGPSQSSPLSDNSVNDKVSPPKCISIENNPEYIRNNQARILHVDFLKSKGLLEEFNKLQASEMNRIVDSNGIFMPTSVPQKEVINSNIVGNTSGETPAVTWVKIVKANIPKFSKLTDSPHDVKFDSDGSAHLSPPKSFLVDARKKWDTSCIGHFVGASFAFKIIKEHAMKLWKDKGLTSVIYNSKGFYIFKFKTVAEMRSILTHKSVPFKGKRMYLGSWIEGTNFQRNVIPSVSIWVKFCEIPHSYWCSEGLTMISKAVGRLIQLDTPTSNLEPIKYAAMLIEVDYGSPRPNFIWVPVLNDVDGTIEQVRIDVLYSSLPYSCKLCCAFGHSYARCSRNPENKKQRTTPDTNVNKNNDQFLGCDVEKDPEVLVQSTGASSGAHPSNTTTNAISSEILEGNTTQPAVGLDSTTTMEDMEGVDTNVDNSQMNNTDENLQIENSDDVEDTNTTHDMEADQVGGDEMELSEAKIDTENRADTDMETKTVVTALHATSEPPVIKSVEQIEEGEFIPTSSSVIKTRKAKMKIGSSVFIASQSKKSRNATTDRDGFQQVLNRKSLRSQGDATKSNRSQ